MKETQYDLAVIGDINYDYLGNIPRFPQPDDEVEISPMDSFLGGSGANASVVAARLGLKVAFYSAAGRDASGDALLRLLEGESLTTQFIQRIPERATGLCFGLITANGERRLFAYRGANLDFDSTLLDEDALSRCRRLHLNGPLYPSALDAMPRAHALGVPTSIDPGSILIEQHRRDMPALFPVTDVLFLNQVELRALSGAEGEEHGARMLLEQGVAWVVIKNGEDGSTLWRDGEAPLICPAFRIEAVDTTGSGDAFNAAFLFALIQNYPPYETLQFANAVGAIVAGAVGATSSAPRSARQVYAFINNTSLKRV